MNCAVSQSVPHHSLRLGLHMAEVEQKGKIPKIRKWTYTGCDQIVANPNPPNSKPDSDDSRNLEIWTSSTGWSNPNICTKILPTRHSRSNQDPACLSEWVPAACGDGVVCVSYLAATHCWEQSINGLCMSHIHPMSLLIWSLCVHYTATHPRRPNRDARRL